MRLSKLARAKVLLKLVFDTEDHVLSLLLSLSHLAVLEELSLLKKDGCRLPFWGRGQRLLVKIGWFAKLSLFPS